MKRICPIHGIYGENRCPKCKSQTSKRYDKYDRNKELFSFYTSSKWRRLRERFIRANPICATCGYPARVVDHIKEIEDGGEKLSWNNLQSLCIPCHNSKTQRAKANRGGLKNLWERVQSLPMPLQNFHKVRFRGAGVKNNITDVTDIDGAKWEYENTPTTLPKLSEKYGKYPMFWSRLAKKEGWKKYICKGVSSPPAPPQTSKIGDAFQEFQAKYAGTAKRKVEEIINELGILYSPVDEPLILMYADLYEKYLILSDIVRRDWDLVETANGAKYTNPRFNNYLGVMERLAKIGDRLGLSISSRKRLGLFLGEKSEKTDSIFNLVNIIDEDIDV